MTEVLPDRRPAAAIVLASGSAARAALLRGAGVFAVAEAATIDEAEIKISLRAAGADAAAAAATLAELKAQKVSSRHPGDLVIGADQILDCGGRWFDKPENPAQARDDLRALRGRSHDLHSCVVAVCDGARLWHRSERATLT
ncbi:MAG: Maf family protein, partial [Dongiaceae bacterium]